ncbi:MAG: hypothetical protein WD934_06935 [Gemmatimonadales bacterium]
MLLLTPMLPSLAVTTVLTPSAAAACGCLVFQRFLELTASRD